MVKFSIIIPVYNVQDYIARCLDSILAQTVSDFEVLCINDGSTDLSGDICEQYAQKDNRIRVFHIANQGVSFARNYGLSKMQCEWFAFVDADDWVEPDYLQILYDNAIINSCTISACNYQRKADCINAYNEKDNRVRVFNSSEECIHNFICSSDSMQGMVFNKLYYSGIYGNIRFNTKLKVNEDCVYTYEVMKLCERACYSNLKLYYWYIRQGSASYSKKIETDFSSANVFIDLYNKTLTMNDEEVSKILKYDYICAVIKILMYAKYKMKDSEVIAAKKQCQIWKKDVWKKFSLKEKIKYVIAMYIPCISHLFR